MITLFPWQISAKELRCFPLEFRFNPKFSNFVIAFWHASESRSVLEGLDMHLSLDQSSRDDRGSQTNSTRHQVHISISSQIFANPQTNLNTRIKIRLRVLNPYTYIGSIWTKNKYPNRWTLYEMTYANFPRRIKLAIGTRQIQNYIIQPKRLQHLVEISRFF